MTIQWFFRSLLGLLVRAWVRTLRVRFVAPEAWQTRRRPVVFAFWHGQQMPLLRMPRGRPMSTLVSWSADGALQAVVMRRLGIDVVRGSSTRDGARGLKRIVSRLRSGNDVAFAADGPRGPRARAKPGALFAARVAHADLVALGAACQPRWVLRDAWDRFELPLPFARVVIVAWRVPEAAPSPEQVARAIEGARVRAEALLNERRATVRRLGQTGGAS